MSESLTGGYQEPCDNPGGIDIAYAFEVKDCDGTSSIANFETESDGVTVSALELTSGKQAYAFEVEVETGQAQTESAGEKTNGATVYTHTVTNMIHRNLAADICNRKALVDGRHAWIVKNAGTGNYELFCYPNGGKAQVTRATGQTYEDMNGATITAVSREKQPEYIIPEAIVTALLTPAS